MDDADKSVAMLDRARALWREDGRYDEALGLYRAILDAQPDDLRALQGMGALLAELGRLDEAEAALRRTLAGAPSDAAARYTLGSVLLSMGRYAEGWSYHGARFEIEALGNRLPPLAVPRWQSFHPANKTVLIVPEQGFGDQIQFARFGPGLGAAGARVGLLAKPPLMRLFRDSFPQASVVALEGEVSFPEPDFYVMSGDLAGLAGITPETVPCAPYLTAPPPPPLPPGFRVGFMSRGNPALTADHLRSLPGDVAERLRAALPGTVVDLAPEVTGARDFADTAALISGLDLVVTVDTAVAHLAGALGKRCLTLVRSFASDWRWPRLQPTTPWYPSMTLHWASLEGDWSAAIDEVAALVQAEAAR